MLTPDSPPRMPVDTGITEGRVQNDSASDTAITAPRPPERSTSTSFNHTPSNYRPAKRRAVKFFAGRKKDPVQDAPSSKPKQKFTLLGQLREVLFRSWLYVLLLFVPIGIALNYAHVSPVAVFVINFIAIIPSNLVLSHAVEEITLRTGNVVGALLNISFR